MPLSWRTPWANGARRNCWWTWIVHFLAKKNIPEVIGYKKHTHDTPVFEKYRFKYDEEFDTYIYPEKTPLLENNHLRWVQKILLQQQDLQALSPAEGTLREEYAPKRDDKVCVAE